MSLVFSSITTFPFPTMMEKNGFARIVGYFKMLHRVKQFSSAVVSACLKVS